MCIVVHSGSLALAGAVNLELPTLNGNKVRHRRDMGSGFLLYGSIKK